MDYDRPLGASRHTTLLFDIAADLFKDALSSTSRAIEARKKRRAPKRGQTLKPGPDTPLWNELVRQVRPHLKKRGSKAQLARLLLLSRQRLHVCLKAEQGCFDAERTLLLLAWLQARQQGREIIA
jgi:hypothetical protein